MDLVLIEARVSILSRIPALTSVLQDPGDHQRSPLGLQLPLSGWENIPKAKTIFSHYSEFSKILA